MIAQLTGKVISTGTSSVVLGVGGVGYRVHTTLETTKSLPKDGSEVTMFTYMAVRENSLDLFGFIKETEVTFFELLISVSGIGPKSALSIMNLETVTALSSAISQGDTTYLTKVSGIGRKSAEKIIIELRDKTATLSSEDSILHSEDAEALEGLQSLGYTVREAREALKMLPADISGTGGRITAALKLLGK